MIRHSVHDERTNTLTMTIPLSEEMVEESVIENSRKTIESFFIAAGFTVKEMWELANGYWPRNIRYFHVRTSNPWWLVETDIGKIVIGPRKRVYQIDWSRTAVRGSVTDKDVTKGDTYVHCWEREDILTCLLALRKLSQNG